MEIEVLFFYDTNKKCPRSLHLPVVIIVSQNTEFFNYESKCFYEKENKKLCFSIPACSRIEENESLMSLFFFRKYHIE